MPEPPKPVPGAAAICLHGESVLLIRRGRPPHEGRWSLPGGKIQPGETAAAAAAREVLEETGLRVEILDVVDVFDAILPPFHYCVADFLAVPAGACDEQPLPRPGTDAADACWASIDRLADFEVSDAVTRVVARALRLAEVRELLPPSLHQPPGGMVRPTILGIYAITEAVASLGRRHVDVARSAVEGGARCIQLRDKHADAGDLLPEAREIAAVCRDHGALFIVNDRVDLAMAAGADGVHVGQSDLPVREVRRLLGPNRLIGVSVEDEAQVLRAEAEGADYLGVGPVFGTATKPDAGEAVGTAQIVRFAARTTLPIIGIGGIAAANLPEVRQAGASAAAVITAISRAGDMTRATRALVEAWGQVHSPVGPDGAAS